MTAESVYLVSGRRTPIGAFLGALSTLPAPVLGGRAIRAALDDAGVPEAAVQEVYMGCVLTAGIGQAPARQALFQAGLTDATGATTVGKVCGSGMKAVMLARAEILAGDADVLVAGGMESMSLAPHLLPNLRTGTKMGHQSLVDSMIHDGLWDPYGNSHMGSCAEQCVEKYQFSRETQDAFAVQSYDRARAAQAADAFAQEIAPVSVPQRKGDPKIIAADEGPTSVDTVKIATLKAAFEKTGSITAGNASSLNDGAAALVVASQRGVEQHGLKPMARIVATATHSQEPLWFTTAPVGAIQKVLEKAGLSAADIDHFELNEAFATVVLAAIQELNLDPAKVNPLGGAIALGHPIGASGARILVTLIHALQRSGGRYGLASLCIGGGEATAVIVENLKR